MRYKEQFEEYQSLEKDMRDSVVGYLKDWGAYEYISTTDTYLYANGAECKTLVQWPFSWEEGYNPDSYFLDIYFFYLPSCDYLYWMPACSTNLAYRCDDTDKLSFLSIFAKATFTAFCEQLFTDKEAEKIDQLLNSKTEENINIALTIIKSKYDESRNNR